MRRILRSYCSRAYSGRLLQWFGKLDSHSQGLKTAGVTQNSRFLASSKKSEDLPTTGPPLRNRPRDFQFAALPLPSAQPTWLCRHQGSALVLQIREPLFAPLRSQSHKLETNKKKALIWDLKGRHSDQKILVIAQKRTLQREK